MKFTVKITPVPLEFAVPTIEPVIVDPVASSKFVLGRMAWYEAAGLPFWMVAFPPGPEKRREEY